jgi:ribosomal-protein-alanine N-acetyltransferase
MSEADLAAVVALGQQCGLNSWSREGYGRELGDPSAILLVAYASAPDGAPGEVLVGFLAGRVAADEFELHDLAVAEGRRREGVGSVLLEAGRREARARGAVRGVLEVRASNLAAQAFYQRHGYAGVGRRRDYYGAPPEDAWVMACEGAAWAVNDA